MKYLLPVALTVAALLFCAADSQARGRQTIRTKTVIRGKGRAPVAAVVVAQPVVPVAIVGSCSGGRCR